MLISNKLQAEIGQNLVNEFRFQMAKKRVQRSKFRTWTSNHNASGNASRTAKYILKDLGSKLEIVLDGAEYIKALQFGRKPTASAGGNLLSAIKKWLIDKKLTANPNAITTSIHNKGTARYAQPNKEENEVISDTFSEEAYQRIIPKNLSDKIAKEQTIQLIAFWQK